MLSPVYNGHNLIFVVGSPRSGTTWLQRLLAAHPSVRTGQESGLFDSYVGPQLRAWRRDLDPATSGRSAVGMGCYLREEEFLDLLRGYMLRLLEPMVGRLAPGQLFLEKTPSHALFIPEIMELLPQSRIIHILRDARDVSASLLAAAKSWGSYWAPGHPRGAAGMWVDHVRAARAAAQRLPHAQFLEVRYEDMYGDTRRVLRRTLSFLGLQWSDEELGRAVTGNRPELARQTGGTAIEVGGEFRSRGTETLREPDGFIRRAGTQTWRRDLSLRDRLWVWLVARKTMAEVGYRWSLPI
ncbi:MAG TPA: sulfotransferase [Steroidobacteraceae bacterium]|nr:sulfotransferase [Steroidobacteraceae bacterium]